MTDADQALMKSVVGRAVTTAIRQQRPDAEVIHPQMNLELDLGLDSLARAECLVNLEQALTVTFRPEDEASALTVAELISLAATKSGQSVHLTVTHERDWHDILADATPALPEVQPLLERKPFTLWIARFLLKLTYGAAHVLFRLQVEGREQLNKIQAPFLICPNHQSYLDAVLVCSTYPRRLLPKIFHVGATKYFSSRFGAWLANRLHIVPVDTDTNLLSAMRASAAGLRAGQVLNLYPEGHRTFAGELDEFRKGAAILATELNLPIVPVALDGLQHVWPREAKWIHFAQVKIRFGAPILPAPEIATHLAPKARYEAVTQVLRNRIQQMLEALRQSPNPN